MSKQTVITIDGSTHLRSMCRQINNSFYTIGNSQIENSGQCYLIDDKYVRLTSGLIEYDHQQGRYVKKSEATLTEGIVYFKDGIAKIGYFTPSNDNIYVYQNDVKVRAMNEAILNGCFEEMADTYWHNILETKANGTYSKLKDVYRKALKVSYPRFDTNNIYNSAGHPMLGEVTTTYTQYDHDTSKFKDLEKFLNNITFGVEFETSNGTVPEKYLLQNGVIPLKDGSISGYEYTTIPLSGKKGLAAISEFCDKASKFCYSDHTCSLHIHFGNIDFDKLFIVSFYALCCRLQTELFGVIPPFKKDAKFLANKGGKDHNAYLNDLGLPYNEIVKNGVINEAQLENWYRKIIAFINEGNTSDQKFVHEGANKWDCPTRYYCVNLMGAIFKKDKNAKTVEFRLHTSTLNKVKTINWLLLCVGIIRYALEYPTKILANKEKININTIIEQFQTNFGEEEPSEYNIFVAAYLFEYFKKRRDTFARSFVTKDLYCDSEYKGDRDYNFTINGGRSLV